MTDKTQTAEAGMTTLRDDIESAIYGAVYTQTPDVYDVKGCDEAADAVLEIVNAALAASFASAASTKQTTDEAKIDLIAEAIWLSDNPKQNSKAWEYLVRYTDAPGHALVPILDVEHCRRRARAVLGLEIKS